MKATTRHWAGITAGILSLAGYATAASLGSEKYSYDASGNIIEKSIDGVVTKMAYDQANRLIGRQTAAQGKETTAYDAASRPVTERNADGQTTRSLSYGYGDKVLETQNQDSKTGFFYNAEGQLVGKKTDGNVSTYAWDGNVLAADGSEAFANEAHVSGGVPVLGAAMEVVVSDYLGNTLAQGNSQFNCTAYGEGLEAGRLTGKQFIKELGCYVFNYRLYSSAITRWTTMDPLGYPDGENSYSFVNGDPLSKIDVYGQMTVGVVLGPIPGITNYSKIIDGVTYTYRVTFTAYLGTCNNGITEATLWKSLVIIDAPQPAPPAPQYPVMTQAVKDDIALYHKTNCHGYTLGVDAWINPEGAGFGSNDIDGIIKGEGYKISEDKDNLAKIVTYGNISHSAVVSVYVAGKVNKVMHKDANVTKIATGPIAHDATGYGAVTKYWEK